MDNFFTWEYISSYAGTVVAVMIITQFIKGVGFIDRIPTRFTSYVIALVIMTAAMCFTAGFSWRAFAIVPINAVVISLAANGAYDGIVDEVFLRLEAEEERDADDGGDDV